MELKRSKKNKMIAGVCGGIGEKYEIDPAIVRLIFAVTALMGMGLSIIIYIVMALLLDEKEE